MCNELQQFYDWFASNKLSINVEKTTYIFFNYNRPTINTDMNVVMNGISLKRVNSTKFLGVHIDANLSWVNHIAHISNQVSKGIGILSKLKHIMPPKIMRSIYLSLVLPHLSYCSSIWSGTTKTNLNKLYILQKRAVRNITCALPRSSTNEIFSSLNLLKLEDLISLNVATFTYRCLNNLLPGSFSSFYS